MSRCARCALALLEADVNFKVVKDFVGRVRERAIGVEVMQSLTPGPAGHQDRPRGADRHAGRAEQARPVRAGAARDHAGGPAGLRQDDDGGQAGADACARAASGPCWWRRTPTARRPSHSCEVLGKQLDIPVHSEGDQASPPPEICVECAQARPRGRPTRWSSWTPPAACTSTTQMMGELEEIKARHAAAGSPAGGRCDDRPGCRAGGRRVQQAGRPDRPDPDQGGRRRPRRRGDLDARGDRRARSSSWAWAKRPTRWNRSIPTAWPRASWAWATC